MGTRFGWGHININVSDLDNSIDFYRKLGFDTFIPGIPYLNLSSAQPGTIPDDAAEALGLADVATCVDPDGTLIELLQVHLERWGTFLAQ